MIGKPNWRFAVGFYKITSNDMCLEISLVDLEKLHIHEEVVPKLVDQLAESIVKDKVLRHPVMVDQKSLVVLDGMHRVAEPSKGSAVAGCLSASSTITIQLLDSLDGTEH